MEKLAIHGGPKVIDEPLAQAWPVFDEREKRALLEVLESRKWGRSSFDYFNNPESKLWQFEQAFARYFEAEHALCVSTGTTALETCLRTLGVEAGCEVIVPAITYIATASCVLACNGVPVFADIKPSDGTIDPKHVEALITPYTKAVIAVDFSGIPCDTDALRAICDSHGIALVSDCSHAHGSKWKGKSVGSFADIAAFSCMPLKLLGVGECGMVLTHRQDYYDAAFSYHHAGRERGEESRDHTWPATTLRVSEFEAAIGCVAITRLDEQADLRWANAQRLIAGLREIPGLAPVDLDERVTRWNPYFFHFKYRSEDFEGIPRNVFQKALAAEGVHCASGQAVPLYKFKMFASGQWGRTGCPVRCPLYKGQMKDYSQVCCPEAERMCAEESLKISQRVLLGPPQNMDKILDAMRKVRQNAAELARLAV